MRCVVGCSMLFVAACGAGARPVVNQACIDGTVKKPVVSPNPHPRAAGDVDQELVEGHRIVGARRIAPDEDTQTFMHQHGVHEVTTSFRICLTEAGVPESVDLLSYSCFPRYEEKVHDEMLTWRYSPYTVDGKAVPVCTAVSFIYRQR